MAVLKDADAQMIQTFAGLRQLNEEFCDVNGFDAAAEAAQAEDDHAAFVEHWDDDPAYEDVRFKTYWIASSPDGAFIAFIVTLFDGRELRFTVPLADALQLMSNFSVAVEFAYWRQIAAAAKGETKQ